MRKVSLSNIADELAAKSGLPRDVADNFMHAFVEAIEKGLQEDNLVKIKGLGTFKLQEVSDRGSVDVNTGERITIKGHRKVTFTPESAMKEFVNRPFAHFEPTELNDDYPADDEPVTSVDLADEAGDMAENTEVAVPDIAVEAAGIYPEVVANTASIELSALSDSEQAVDEPAVEVITGEATAESEPQVIPVDDTTEAVVPVAESEEKSGLAAETIEVSMETVIEESVEIPEEQLMEESAEELIEEPMEDSSEESAEDPVIEPVEETIPDTEEKADAVAHVEQQTDEPADPITEKTAASTDQPKPESKKKTGCLWTIMLVLLLLVAASFLMYFYLSTPEERSLKNDMDEYGEMMVNPNLEEELGIEWDDEPEVTPQLPAEKKKTVEVSSDSTNAQQPPVPSSKVEDSSSQSTVMANSVTAPLFCELTITESLAAKTIKDITPADTTDYTIGGTLVTHQLKSGETIIQLAKKYYGDKRLWPYIVKYNWMKDYNNVAIGQMINIPVLKDKPTE